MLMELLFWRKYAGTRKTVFCLLTTACRYFSDISHYEFGKMFVTRITLSDAFKKIIKMSKWWVFQRRISSRFEPWTPSSWSTVWIHAIRACFRKQHSVVYLLIHFTISIITVTSNHPPFLFSSETWEAALSSLSLSVSRACNDVCVSLWQF